MSFTTSQVPAQTANLRQGAGQGRTELRVAVAVSLHQPGAEGSSDTGCRLDSARLLIAGLSAVDELLKQRSENFDQGFGLDLGQGAKANHLPHHLEARDQ
jgi:hypothetical protein